MSARRPPPRRAVPSWLSRALADADWAPVAPREPILLGSAGPAIGSLEPALATRIAAAGLPLAPDGKRWTVVGPPDRALAAIADWLLRQPLGLRRRDELLPVVDQDGRTLAGVERGVVRVLGLRTFAVHLSARAADGRFWVQQRAFDKATDPGRWDTLMGGQMAAGEGVEATLERETAEEAGLGLADLEGLARGPDVTVRRPVAEGWMDEHIAVFAPCWPSRPRRRTAMARWPASPACTRRPCAGASRRASSRSRRP